MLGIVKRGPLVTWNGTSGRGEEGTRGLPQPRARGLGISDFRLLRLLGFLSLAVLGEGEGRLAIVPVGEPGPRRLLEGTYQGAAPAGIWHQG